MSSNLFGNLDTLLAGQAGFNASKNGATGVGFLDKATPLINFLASAASAQAQGGGAAQQWLGGLQSMSQGMAQRNYLKQVQEAQAQQRQFELGKWQYEQEQNQNTVDAIGEMFNPDGTPKSIHGRIKPNSNAGQILDMAKLYFPQVAASTNYLNRGQGIDAIQDGQQQGMPGQQPQLTPQSQGPTLPPLNSVMNPQQQSQAMQAMGTNQAFPDGMPLQGSAAVNVGPKQIGGNAFFLPSEIPTNYSNLLKAGLEDTQKQETLNETVRSNKAGEDLKNKIYQATASNQGGYGRNYPQPPQGRGLNQQELLLQLYGEEGLKNAGFGLPQGKGSNRVEQIAKFQGVMNNNLKTINSRLQDKSLSPQERTQLEIQRSGIQQQILRIPQMLNQMNQAGAQATQNVRNAGSTITTSSGRQVKI